MQLSILFYYVIFAPNVDIGVRNYTDSLQSISKIGRDCLLRGKDRLRLKQHDNLKYHNNMKKFFTLSLVALLGLSAYADITVTRNGAPVANGSTIELTGVDFKEPDGIPGFEIAEYFNINGAQPFELLVTADDPDWTYCTDGACSSLILEDGVYQKYQIVDHAPFILDANAKYIMLEEMPKKNMSIKFELTDADDATFDFTVHMNSTEGSVAGIISDSNEPVEYFSLTGVKMNASNLPAGIYVCRQGATSRKVLVK